MKHIIGKFVLPVLLGMAVGPVAQAATELVANGGFESNSGAYTSPLGWGVDGYASVMTDNELLHVATNEGSYAMGFGSSVRLESLTQSLATVAGQAYSFSFSLANTAFFWPQNGGLVNEFRALWNGESVFAETDLSADGWKTYSFEVTAADALTEISFQGMNAGGGTLALDSVSVVAVPEPSSYVLLLAGLGLIGGAARRKRHA